MLEEQAMGWEQLHEQLRDAFRKNDVICQDLLSVVGQEEACSAVVQDKCGGHCLLSDCFQEFLRHTLNMASTQSRRTDMPPVPVDFAPTWWWQVSNLRLLRATDVLFHHGYPMQGLALLRQLKEQALFLGAMLSGITSWAKIKGLEEWTGRPLTEQQKGRVRSNRMKEEKRVLNLMIRKHSRLPKEDLSELARWESVFNLEIHGGFLTQWLDHGPGMRGNDGVSLGPELRTESLAMYMNRFCEVAWMLHRTLPILQLSDRRFDQKWVQTWRLLDENFYAMEYHTLAEANKRVREAIIRFMRLKFSFAPDQDCFDRDACQPRSGKTQDGQI